MSETESLGAGALHSGYHRRVVVDFVGVVSLRSRIFPSLVWCSLGFISERTIIIWTLRFMYLNAID